MVGNPLPTIKINSRWPRESRNYMLPWEQGLLLTMLDGIKPKRMIEFGINEGITASAVLKWIDSLEYYLGIDVPFEHVMPLPGQQPEVPKEAGCMVKSDPRVEIMLRANGFSDNMICAKAPFDVAFIDGDHSRDGVLRDIDVAEKILRPNGWIFWHDYNNGTVEVTGVLQERQQSGRNVIHIDGTMLAYEQL